MPGGDTTNWSELTDAKLAGLAAAGIEKAFVQLLHGHRQRILKIGLRMLCDRIEAEEGGEHREGDRDRDDRGGAIRLRRRSHGRL